MSRTGDRGSIRLSGLRFLADKRLCEERVHAEQQRIGIIGSRMGERPRGVVGRPRTRIDIPGSLGRQRCKQ